MRQPENEASPNMSTVLFGTVNGVIGVVASLSEEQFLFFHQLEQAMQNAVNGEIYECLFHKEVEKERMKN